MKVEIKINKYGDCEYFKINGQKYDERIYGYQIIHIAGEKPKLLIETSIDELIIDGEKVDIFRLEKEDKDK